MVNIKQGFGGASGASALEATGGVTSGTFMGRSFSVAPKKLPPVEAMKRKATNRHKM